MAGPAARCAEGLNRDDRTRDHGGMSIPPAPAPGPSGPADPGDPRPVPPERPLPGDCCGGGCDPCVYDLYDEALADYRERLAQWRARHPGAD